MLKYEVATMKYAKRDVVAAISRISGFTRVLSALPHKPLLLALNYHRIGDRSTTPYDPEIFSAFPDEFDEQVAFTKRRFHVVTLEEAVDIIERPRQHRGTSVLFTFDDGYLDNYETAFPILRSHGVQGTFFLPTAFIGTNRISWWDSAAYIVRNSRRLKFRIGGEGPEIDLESQHIDLAIAQVLNYYRSVSGMQSEEFLELLEEACNSSRPPGTDRSFMNWEEAAEMVRGGMAVGSHTHNHEILARLPDDEQYEELALSRRILEGRLGLTVKALSYPVGLPHCFSPSTRDAACRAGYRIAFSFYGGFNVPGSIDRYDVLRQCAYADRSIARYQLRHALAAATGSYWF